jgi:hypothetical protein
MLGDGLRNFGCPRVKAVDHKCLHRDGPVRALEGVHIEPRLFPVLVIAELAHLLTPSAINLVKATSLKTVVSDTATAINPLPGLAA